ncbi:OmpW/AlkL family protein [Pedobacter cryoconitis]|uniref:OmpW/AlkL family protein n=1 Tax=Pedobacter cryoconitis TaxID=188932 RepID=UPI00160A4F2A|nr:OmpW family outer membrane protein [Pedobacter cryoconitis]MBB5645079.1 outer membrane protein [Pedobacter cryoconitis]
MKKVWILALLISSTLTGLAQQKGEWRVRLRGTVVAPDASAAISTIGGSADISTTVIPELDFTYFLTKNFSANLILGTTRHQITATETALGDVNIGKVWLLPPTLTFLYHAPVAKGILPYIGAGINYTIFYGAKNGPAIANTDYKNKFAFAAQIGSDFDIGKNLFLNADVKKIWLRTDATVTTIPGVAGGATVIANTKIDPWLFSFGIGKRF